MFSSILCGLLVAILLLGLLMGALLINVHRFKFKYYPATIALLVMTRNSPLHWIAGGLVIVCVGLALYL